MHQLPDWALGYSAQHSASPGKGPPDSSSNAEKLLSKATQSVVSDSSYTAETCMAGPQGNLDTDDSAAEVAADKAADPESKGPAEEDVQQATVPQTSLSETEKTEKRRAKKARQRAARAHAAAQTAEVPLLS